MQGANVASSPLLLHQHKWPVYFTSDDFRALRLKVCGHASAMRTNTATCGLIFSLKMFSL